MENQRAHQRQEVNQTQGRRKKKSNTQRKKNPLIKIIVLLVVFYFIFSFFRQEYYIWQLNAKKKNLQATLKSQQLKGNELKEELEEADSQSYIEYLAKKYLGLIYPNEKVYVPTENGE